jgi:hypothetical protein
MTMRKLSPQGYIRTIKNLALFLGRSPDTASFEDVRRFQLHVAASGVGAGAINATVVARHMDGAHSAPRRERGHWREGAGWRRAAQFETMPLECEASARAVALGREYHRLKAEQAPAASHASEKRKSSRVLR